MLPQPPALLGARMRGAGACRVLVGDVTEQSGFSSRARAHSAFQRPRPGHRRVLPLFVQTAYMLEIGMLGPDVPLCVYL